MQLLSWRSVKWADPSTGAKVPQSLLCFVAREERCTEGYREGQAEEGPSWRRWAHVDR